MIFPVNIGADADAYIMLANNCLINFPFHCGSSVRPVGVIFYYTLLVKLFPDPVRLSYVILMLNLFYIFGIYFIINKIFNKTNQASISLYLFFIVAINLVCLLPVSMSDLIALFMFLIGIYFILDKVHLAASSTRNNLYIFLSGFFFGLACLFKQNYGVFGLVVAFVLLCFNLNSKHGVLANKVAYTKKILFFTLGFSVVFLQVGAIFYKFHIIGLFVPFPVPNHQPFVEAFGYTNIINSSNDLSPGFYYTIIDHHVSSVFFYLYKIIYGLSHTDLMIYHGDRPTVSNLVSIGIFDYMKVFIYIFGFIFMGFLLFAKTITNRNNQILFVSALLISLVISLTFHVENRYYILPRILLFCLLIPILQYVKSRLIKRKFNYEDLY